MNLVETLNQLVKHVKAADLHCELDYTEQFPVQARKSLTDWKMELDDAPIFRYLYRNHKPLTHHLEFGTWKGLGTVYCLDESEAAVCTINLADGESDVSGNWLYDEWLDEAAYGDNIITRTAHDGRTIVQTDARDAIGIEYVTRNYQDRVKQFYCDSRDWNDAKYSDGFFDSVLIDGGHDCQVVINDTKKALRLVRPGGLIMWHDYCPNTEVMENCKSTQGVGKAIYEMFPELNNVLTNLFWIDSSWILLGVR